MYFATCVRHTALEFIQSVYPLRELKDEGPMKSFLDLVEADKIRVTDPSMHGQAEVIPGTHWVEDEKKGLMESVVEMAKWAQEQPKKDS